jgi:hypothetical protein
MRARQTKPATGAQGFVGFHRRSRRLRPACVPLEITTAGTTIGRTM